MLQTARDSSTQFHTVPHWQGSIWFTSTLMAWPLGKENLDGLKVQLRSVADYVVLCYKGDSTKFHEMRTGMWDANWNLPLQGKMLGLTGWAAAFEKIPLRVLGCLKGCKRVTHMNRNEPDILMSLFCL